MVTKMPALKSTLDGLVPGTSTCGSLFLIAAWMTWICCEISESWSGSSRLNSSKHPHAPHLTSPTKMRPMLFESMPSSQLNTSTCRPKALPSALTDSVLPVPAGPYGLPP